MLTLVGVAGGYLPFVPAVPLTPEVVLLGLLPPLLYAAALQTSLVDLGANRRNIALLSVGLVVVTALAVGLVVWALLEVPLPLAIALGGVVAPPDAVAATAVARRIGLPRRIVTILEGESLFNDATALVVVRMGIVATGTAVTAWDVAGQFVWASAGGVAVGVVVKTVLVQVRRRVSDPTADTLLGLLAPFLAFLPAEALHCSGVLAVVTAGLLLGHSAPVVQTALSRTSERITWRSVAFLLENAVFLLIGLQTRSILEGVARSEIAVPRLAAVCLAVLATVVVVRVVVVLGIQLLSLGGGLPVRSRLQAGGVASWAGMRGVVTLAAALTLPVDAPRRDALVLVALAVTLGTLVLHGFSLPWVARRLDVHGPDPREDVLQTATVLQRAVAAGRAELGRLATREGLPEELVTLLRDHGERRTHAVWELLGTGQAGQESPSETHRRVRTAMLAAERAEVLRLRDAGAVDHEVLATVLATLDVEESLLAGTAERRDATAGRVVLTPEVARGDCPHLLTAAGSVEPQTPQGCAACLREGSTWVHLRLCLACGTVGCCDSSPRRHAAAHARDVGHPVVRSFEPGEGWRWCYVDELLG